MKYDSHSNYNKNKRERDWTMKKKITHPKKTHFGGKKVS